MHLDQPGPDTGVFNTDEVSQGKRPLDYSTSRIIAFPSGRYKEPPKVAGGWKSIDHGHTADVRLNFVGNDPDFLLCGRNITPSQMKVELLSSRAGQFNSGSVTWIETKADAKDCQMGNFSTYEVHGNNNLNPPQKSVKSIQFERPFKEPPEVVCWLKLLHLKSGGPNYRIIAYATNITTTGFTANLNTWEDSTVLGAAMCWIAFPKDKRKVAGGHFYTNEVRPWTEPREKTSKQISFPPGRFKKPPVVLVALNELDMKGDKDLRIKVEATDITKDGFTWHLDTWDDSVLYGAGGGYVALGFA